MGVYIPNMSKPKECGGCQFNVNQMGGGYEWQECVLLNEDITHFDIAQDDCPLIEINLVRCGECEWWDRDGKRKDGKGWCENVICGLTKPNAFCSYGERRE